MGIKVYNPCTPSLRNKKSLDFSIITKIKPEKSLLKNNHRAKGRNNQGRITVRHKGGGHKRCYRIIDFKRNVYNVEGVVSSIEYDPNRNCNISLIIYKTGEKRYILHPENLKCGELVISKNRKEILNSENILPSFLKIGNALPLEFIPNGTFVHNLELNPGKGGQIARSAGAYAKVLTKEKNFVIVRLSSKEIRFIRKECMATIGKVGNSEVYNLKLGKAGRKRWLGIRPTVRGSAMNAVDHPHGGGEGKCPIGKPRPMTPWGKPALGVKTRKLKNKNNIFIIRSRK